MSIGWRKDILFPSLRLDRANWCRRQGVNEQCRIYTDDEFILNINIREERQARKGERQKIKRRKGRAEEALCEESRVGNHVQYVYIRDR